MRRLGFAALALAGTALAGCADSLDRRDTITAYSGEAVAYNKAAQVVNPWPTSSTELATSGQRMQVAIERYNANKTIQPQGLNTSSVAVQASVGGK
jgi:hypothetical protein